MKCGISGLCLNRADFRFAWGKEMCNIKRKAEEWKEEEREEGGRKEQVNAIALKLLGKRDICSSDKHKHKQNKINAKQHIHSIKYVNAI